MLWPGLFGREVVSEVVELSSIIAEIYDAAINPGLWENAIARICAYVGGHSAALYWHDAATERSEVVYLFNEHPDYTKLYFEKYAPMNPVFPAATFVEEGVVATVATIIPRAEFIETRFYKEWAKPQGIEDALSVNLEKGVARVALFSIRTAAVPDEAMSQRMALLVPHLQRAVAIGRLFDHSKSREQALTSMFDHVEVPVFMIGSGRQISFANDPGRKLLDEATLVYARQNGLHTVGGETDRILHDLFVAAEEGDASIGVRGVAVTLTDASQERWFAHVLPLTSGRRQQSGEANHAVAAVFIRKTAPNAPPLLEAVAKSYKLTATEVRVLDALLRVNGVKAMAEMLGLSQATVKTHLHNLFRKTGTTRQSDLVKLVAGL
jgi:DNA-binding CsgD family transcriptional regulator